MTKSQVRVRPSIRHLGALFATLLLAATVVVGVASPAAGGTDGSRVDVYPVDLNNQGIAGNHLSLHGFEGTLTVTFTGDGVDCDQIVVAAAALSEGSELSVPCDIGPGWTVTVSDTAGHTASVLVQDLWIGGFEDTMVSVWVDPDDPDVSVGCDGDVVLQGPGPMRWVQATGLTWLDLSEPGPCAAPEDDSTVASFVEGDNFVLRIEDADGDATVHALWQSPAMLFRESERGTVYGKFWTPGAEVTVEVLPIDSGTGQCGTTPTATETIEVSDRGEIKARMAFNAGNDCVRATGGGETVLTYPNPPTTCEVDQGTDIVTVDLTEYPEDGFPYVEARAVAPVLGLPEDTIISYTGGPYTGPIEDGFGQPYDFGLGSKVARVSVSHDGFDRWVTCADAPATVIDVELNPAETGYWILTETGLVAGVGLAVPVFDDANDPVANGPAPAPAGLTTGERVVSMSITPSGEGYWLFTDAGRVVARGDAAHFGDMVQLGITLDQPAVDSVALPDGTGYYIVAGDGGIFAFGAAEFLGSVPQVLPGVTLDAPVVGLVPNLAGDGYWLIAADGGIFSFGNVEFKGSIPGVLPGVQLASPVIGALASGDAYLMFANDGGIFNFGTSVFLGSLGANANPDPITSVDVLADRSGYVLVDSEGVVVGFGTAFDLSSGFLNVG